MKMSAAPVYVGGNWDNGVAGGPGAVFFFNTESYSYSSFSFRFALDTASYNGLTGPCQCNQKDVFTPAMAEIGIKPLDASGGCYFARLCEFSNIIKAAKGCKKGKTTKQSSMKFFSELEKNAHDIRNTLINGTYKMGSYNHFWVYEPKRRLIAAPSYRDRVIHRAIYNIIQESLDKRYLYDSYACRTGKGTHAGADRVQSYIKQVKENYGKVYALKADISKYFSSIDHAILKTLINRRIFCSKLKYLLFYIIDSSPTPTPGKGIPLGNLTSQIFANLYLHELDFYIKIKRSIKMYVRYMDDFVIISPNKVQLQKYKREIVYFLESELKLKTNNKTQIFPVDRKHGRALDFLGYRIYSDYRLLRKGSVKKIKSKLKIYKREVKQGKMSKEDALSKVHSWLGHASHANTYGLVKSLSLMWR